MHGTQLTDFDRNRGEVQTRSGPASYVDTGGEGPVALFVHGVGTSSYLWRQVIAQMAGERRCVAVDLPLIVWGTGDVFFRRKWAYWLRDTIPGATEVAEIPGAKLFFPDERASELSAALRRHWHAHLR